MKIGKLGAILVGALALAATAAVAADGGSRSRFGEVIRKTQVAGYTLEYTLIGIPELDATSVMPRTSYDGGYDKTHHLMVFVSRPDGRRVTSGAVSLVVTAPNKTTQAPIARAMDGGHGADVELRFRGSYAVSAKLGLPDGDVADTFEYTVN